MKGRFIGKRRRTTKSISFNPNSDFIDDAVSQFLNKGGKITKVIDLEDGLDDFMSHREAVPPADEYLMG